MQLCFPGQHKETIKGARVPGLGIFLLSFNLRFCEDTKDSSDSSDSSDYEREIVITFCY